MKRFTALLLVLLFVGLLGIVYAEEPKAAPAQGTQAVEPAAPVPAAPKVDPGDTAWVLISTALVMLMTPGLAFFYGGMVGRKNVLGILMQCFTLLCIISVQWVLYGYSLAFGPGKGFWGGFEWIGLAGSGLEPFKDYAATIPHQAFMIFQAMFAVITPALIIGAFAERMKFSAFVIIMILWATFVYDPVAHWVWGVGGWLREMGALDFAGGTVVHINAGIAALMTAIVIKRREGFDHKAILPHNLPFTVLGTALLWFGWFGFNAGSALAANGLSVNAFVVTNTAAAAAGLTWALIDWIFNEKPTMLGTATGAVAGLVAITPAAGFVSALSAIVIGVLVSVFCFVAVVMDKTKIRIRRRPRRVRCPLHRRYLGRPCHRSLCLQGHKPRRGKRPLLRKPQAVPDPVIAVAVTVAYSFVASYIIYKVVDLIIKVRVPEKDETLGLDLTQHHENAYTVLE